MACPWEHCCHTSEPAPTLHCLLLPPDKRRLPPDASFREELEEGWAERLMDRLHRLPALRCIVVVFANNGMVNAPEFEGLWDCLETSRLLFTPIMYSSMSLLHSVWVQ